jgi:glycosyltransferase involved in cell wall biosynthesis
LPDLVSVIIPNFNHSQFLNQRIDSALGQTYQNFEVILLDDASNDHSFEIINSYAKHPKVSHVVVNDSNSGSVFSQWFKGIALAKGNYVWIAESDDWCEKVLLESLLLPLDNNTVQEMEAVFCPDGGDTIVLVKGLDSYPPRQYDKRDMGLRSLDIGYRKPSGGMLEYLATRHTPFFGRIDRKLMVGDMQSDIDAGLAAGYETMWAHEWIALNS